MVSGQNRRTQSIPEEDLEENESLLPEASRHTNSNNVDKPRRRDVQTLRTTISSNLTLIACILLTIVNLTVLWMRFGQDWGVASPASLFLPVNTLSSYADVENLRRPSQFVGLEEIYNKFPHQSKNFTNFPLVLTPVDRVNPSKIFDPEGGTYVKDLGVILPEHGHLQVTPTISSIVQFRATDFMMENCELHITLPDPSMIPSPESTHFELYKLSSGSRLRALELSYSTKPVRVEKVAEITFDKGSDWSFGFPCSRDELFTFEISCPEDSKIDSSCNLDWIQDKEPSSDLAGTFIPIQPRLKSCSDTNL